MPVTPKQSLGRLYLCTECIRAMLTTAAAFAAFTAQMEEIAEAPLEAGP